MLEKLKKLEELVQSSPAERLAELFDQYAPTSVEAERHIILELGVLGVGSCALSAAQQPMQ